MWVESLTGPDRDAAVRRLHGLLLREARHEVRRRTAALAHPSGRDLDDLAVQAADDALMAVLRKLHTFRGEAQFETWARRFVTLEVPGEIRRRVGRGTAMPADVDWSRLEDVRRPGPEATVAARERARAVGHAIAHDLTEHQREVLVALAIQQQDVRRVALRTGRSAGALYKTLHDARRKLAGACA